MTQLSAELIQQIDIGKELEGITALATTLDRLQQQLNLAPNDGEERQRLNWEIDECQSEIYGLAEDAVVALERVEPPLETAETLSAFLDLARLARLTDVVDDTGQLLEKFRQIEPGMPIINEHMSGIIGSPPVRELRLKSIHLAPEVHIALEGKEDPTQLKPDAHIGLENVAGHLESLAKSPDSDKEMILGTIGDLLTTDNKHVLNLIKEQVLMGFVQTSDSLFSGKEESADRKIFAVMNHSPEFEEHIKLAWGRYLAELAIENGQIPQSSQRILADYCTYLNRREKGSNPQSSFNFMVELIVKAATATSAKD